MPHKHGAFRFVFGVQHGLWQKQALRKSKIKTNKKITLREENISAIMLGFLFYDRHWSFLSFFSLFTRVKALLMQGKGKKKEKEKEKEKEKNRKGNKREKKRKDMKEKKKRKEERKK